MTPTEQNVDSEDKFDEFNDYEHALNEVTHRAVHDILYLTIF